MDTVSSRPSVVSLRDSIDAAAEREGAALQWFADNLDQPIRNGSYFRQMVAPRRDRRLGITTLVVCGSQYVLAGNYRYPLAASLRAHQRIAAGNFNVSLASLSKCPTREERRRQAASRAAMRLRMLATLAKLRRGASNREALGVARAASITGFSQRAIYKAVQRLELSALRTDGRGSHARYYFQTADLARFVQSRLDSPLRYPSNPAA